MKKSAYHEIGGRFRKIKTELKRGLNFRYLFYRMKWKWAHGLNIVTNFPQHVDIELNNTCNLKCPMCMRNWVKEKLGCMNFDLYKKIINEAAQYKLPSIKLQFRGEPLMHPKIIDAIKYAKKRGIMEVQFNTNGVLLNKKLAEQLIDSGLDRIIFSVDGATKETYEKIRGKGNFEKVHGNIKYLLELKKKKKSIRPFVRVQMVKMKDTVKDVPLFIKRWTPLVDYVAVNEYSNPWKKDIDRDVSSDVAIGRVPCPQIWRRLVISWDGEVTACCGDWFFKFKLGNVKRDSLYDIWHSKKLDSIRRMHRQKRLNEIPACKDCEMKESFEWKQESI